MGLYRPMNITRFVPFVHNIISKMRPARFELTTPGLGNRCSILLSYGRRSKYRFIREPDYQVQYANVFNIFKCSTVQMLNCFVPKERRGRDSNPGCRFTRHDGLANRYLKPLGHLSELAVSLVLLSVKFKGIKKPADVYWASRLIYH